MDILKRLFGSKEAPLQSKAAPRPSPLAMRETGSSFMSIPSLNFFGSFARSPNGRYTLIWRDGTGTHGGARENGEGRYLLLDEGMLIVDGRMQRPNDGKVANSGIFILNDWRFSSDLIGTFWAFRHDGSLIFSRTFTANLFNNGLSENGMLACCQTCNSSTDDSGKLTIFDLVAGRETSNSVAESGWAQEYEFVAGTSAIQLCYLHGRGSFRYRLSGEFTDREKWIFKGLYDGDLYMARRVLDQASGPLDAGQAERLIKCVEKGLRLPEWREHQAFGWRVRGEIYEACNDLPEATRSYEKAVGLDPKIGVKRRLQKLKGQVKSQEN